MSLKNYNRRLFSLILFLILISPCFAEESFQKWNAQADIQGQGKNRYKAIFLNEQVYQYSNSNLSDLRIIDCYGKFVPFLIENGVSIGTKSETVYTTVNLKSFTKKNQTYLDYKVIPQRKNADITGNKLVLGIPESNYFLKEVRVFGSYDGQQWEYITSGQIYRVDKLVNDSITFGQIEKYIYYRLVIVDNIENIKISGLKLIDWHLQNDWNYFQATTKLPFENETKSRRTNITIKNKQHLRIASVRLSINGNFQRNYQVLQKTPENKNVFVDSGEIYNLQFRKVNISNTNITFENNPIQAEEIIIIIENDDNQPLEIKSIDVNYFVDKIIFEDKDSAPYKLYFGNPDAEKPNYDMERYRNLVLEEEQDILTLSNFDVRDDSKPLNREWFQNKKLIFKIVIVIVTLILMFFLFGKIFQKNN